MSRGGRDQGTDDGEDDVDIAALSARFEAGFAAEARGDGAAAAAAFREALALDPDDRGAAAMRLARLGAAPPPERAPPTYVQMLFDEHAGAFDSCLLGDLDYRAPDLIAAKLRALGVAEVGHAVDLGCGTGLMGALIAPVCRRLTGVDLSGGMLLEARKREIYDALVLGDAVEALAAPEASRIGAVDLVVAADVLIYLGALEALFDATAVALSRGGLVIVTTETLEPGPAPGWRYRVGQGLRFAHEGAYLAAAITGAGLEIVSIDEVTLRKQAGRPVPGHVSVARRP